MERIEKKDIAKRKLYLGPMSKNIVDAIIDYDNNNPNVVGITASRRQIDYNSGYVNQWTTSMFCNYVRHQNKNILICRDHGGPLQGHKIDDGINSLLVDSLYCDIIHIDPFKHEKLPDAIDFTALAIQQCDKYINVINAPYFEVGTEESIMRLDEDDLFYFLSKLKKKIPELFDRIIYAVIQSGTALQSGSNIGEYSEQRLKNMISICGQFNILSKEHNGDYLIPEHIKYKRLLGLGAINIAPEIAHIECDYILSQITNEQLHKWWELCLTEGSWKKWFPKDYDPYYKETQEQIVHTCGHYVFTNPEFINIFDLNNASEYVKNEVHKFINERI